MVVHLMLAQANVPGGRFSVDQVERAISLSENTEGVGRDISSLSMFISSWPPDGGFLPDIS